MLYFESISQHYPYISRSYLIQVEKKQYALMNPYCFSSFFEDVLGVYTNMMIGMSKRKEFSRQKIELNVQQLGCMILGLLNQNFNEDRLNHDDNYRKSCYMHIQKFLSKDLRAFFNFIMRDFNANYPKSFTTVDKWLKSNN